MSEELVKQEGGAIVAADDLKKYAGLGLEHAEANDFAIPFVHILQKLSPQVDEASGQFVKEAKAGQIFISTTSQCFEGKQGISVIQCAFKKNLIEWKPRTSGGGFVKEHAWNEELIQQTVKNEKGQNLLPNNNLLVETKLHYVMIVSNEIDASVIPAVISMTSTQLKKSRKWMSLISMRKLRDSKGLLFMPPSFAFYYNLRVVPESNEHGSWYSWDVEPGPQVEDPTLIREAIKFNKAIGAGEVKIVDSSSALADDDIPF
jgi:hypothetical protein